jgi:hypothetical protein
LVLFHRGEERISICLGWSTELHRDMEDVLHPQGLHRPFFVGKRVARIVVKREVDHNGKPFPRNGGKLRLGGLTGGGKQVVNRPIVVDGA